MASVLLEILLHLGRFYFFLIFTWLQTLKHQNAREKSETAFYAHCLLKGDLVQNPGGTTRCRGAVALLALLTWAASNWAGNSAEASSKQAES